MKYKKQWKCSHKQLTTALEKRGHRQEKIIIGITMFGNDKKKEKCVEAKKKKNLGDQSLKGKINLESNMEEEAVRFCHQLKKKKVWSHHLPNESTFGHLRRKEIQ